MRVLYVIDSLIGGGAEHSLAHMAPGYRDHGLELHVAFLKSRWDVADALREAGAELHPTALGASRPRQLLALVRLIRRLRPDIVHTTLWEADVLGRTAAALTGTPAVTTFASSSYSPAKFDDSSAGRAKLRLAQLVDIASCRTAVRFHAVSNKVARDMTARMRLQGSRIVVIHRARLRDTLGEPSPERRRSVRTSLGLGPDTPTVLAVARLEYQKGLDVLVDAISMLTSQFSNLTVLIAGREGRASPTLHAQVHQLGLGGVVRFLGARSDVADLMVASDLIAVPSRVEGMPGVVLEAMALECPVVGSDIPMIREAIGAHACALVPVNDVEALAAAVRLALTSEHSAVTGAARQRFEAHFTPRPIVAQLAVLYRDAIGASRWSAVRSKR
jgi:glycosyltransferase involved in cell wall biosynthesis